MSDHVQIESVPGMPIAVVRRKVPPTALSSVIPEGCGLVWKAIKAAGVKGAGRHVAIYRDADSGMVDVEVGVELSALFQGSGEVVGSATPPGTVATMTHFGPYGKLGDAHKAIRLWCATQGHRLAGPRWEVYGHWLNEWNDDPSKIRTDIFYLLQS